MVKIFGNVFNRKPKPGGSDEEARNLSASYTEHTWEIDIIKEQYASSGINIQHPSQSYGLSTSEAKELLEKNGPNALPKAKEITNFELLGRQFLNVLWGLLLVAAILSLIAFIQGTSVKPIDLSGLWVAIIITVMIFGFCFVAFYQERKAIKAVSGFKNLLPEVSWVIRDGKEMSVSASELVVGDIIRIKNGTRVPADARILQCSQLKLETSAITGEAEPIEHIKEAVPENVNIFEAKNVGFNGSLCVDGEAYAVVIRTGANTIIGQIASLTTNQDEKPSRLQAQIKKFVKLLGLPACTLGLIIFIIGGFVHKWH
uniref:Cation-transporting P-type ATPase N-terminal domain-containing protein n=1 Tax=Acrobeloides nanus TaxID=290746 RepID=A0A914D505_9BILA